MADSGARPARSTTVLIAWCLKPLNVPKIGRHRGGRPAAGGFNELYAIIAVLDAGIPRARPRERF